MPRNSSFSEVWHLLRAEADSDVRARLGLAILLAGAGGLLAAAAPLALKELVDTVTELRVKDGLPWNAAVWLGAAYVLALCGARLLTDLGPLLTGSAEQRLYRRLTRRAFGHLTRLPMDYLLSRRSGELVRGIDLARAGCQLVVAHAVNGIVPVLVELVTIGVLLAMAGQPVLVAVFAITACAYLAIFTAGARRMTERAGDVSRANLHLHALLADSVQHCETLRCFAAEDEACRRIDAAGEALEQRWLHLNGMRSWMGIALTLTFTLSMGASLFLAGRAVWDGTLTIGGLVLANVYVLQMVRPLEALGAAVRDVAQALGFVGPLLDILRQRQEPATASGTAAGTRRPARSHLAFEEVCFGYAARRPVFERLTLEIADGRTTAIVGASGSGKSTLVRLLLRLCEPQSGRILLGGQPIDAWPASELRHSIGLVPQDTALFHDTIARNIALGRTDADRADIERAARIAQLHDFVASLPQGYETVVGERGLQLSGGERQRLAIARAVLKRPHLYLLDEATSMLDNDTEAAVLRNLRTVAAGCTTIVIAHRLSSVVHADDIVVLDTGRVAERGPHALLLRQGGRYASLWRQQQRGDND